MSTSARPLASWSWTQLAGMVPAIGLASSSSHFSGAGNSMLRQLRSRMKNGMRPFHWAISAGKLSPAARTASHCSRELLPVPALPSNITRRSPAKAISNGSSRTSDSSPISRPSASGQWPRPGRGRVGARRPDGATSTSAAAHPSGRATASPASSWASRNDRRPSSASRPDQRARAAASAGNSPCSPRSAASSCRSERWRTRRPTKAFRSRSFCPSSSRVGMPNGSMRSSCSARCCRYWPWNALARSSGSRSQRASPS